MTLTNYGFIAWFSSYIAIYPLFCNARHYPLYQDLIPGSHFFAFFSYSKALRYTAPYYSLLDSSCLSVSFHATAFPLLNSSYYACHRSQRSSDYRGNFHPHGTTIFASRSSETFDPLPRSYHLLYLWTKLRMEQRFPAWSPIANSGGTIKLRFM